MAHLFLILYLLPLSTWRKETDYGIHWNFTADGKHCFLEAGKVDEINFQVEIWALQLPWKVTFGMYMCKGMYEVCTCDSQVIKSALIRLPTLINHDPQASDYSPIPHMSLLDLIHFRCLTWKQWLIPSPEYADLKMPPNERLCSGFWVKLGHSLVVRGVIIFHISSLCLSTYLLPHSSIRVRLLVSAFNETGYCHSHIWA